MFEGKIVKWDRIELKIDSTVSKTVDTGTDITVDATHDATLELWSAPDYGAPGAEEELWFDESLLLSWTRFLTLSVSAGLSADTKGYSFAIPGLGIADSAILSGYTDSLEARVEIDDYSIWVHNSGVWRVRFGEIRFYFQGSLISTYSGGGTADGTAVLNPWTMPFVSLFPKMYGACAASSSQQFPSSGPFSSVPFDWTLTASVDQTISGGIRFKEGGVWYELPVTASTPDLPTLAGGCEDPTTGSVSAGTTWDTTLSQLSSRIEHGAFCTEADPNVGGVATIRKDVWTETESKSASCWLWPDLTRSIERATGSDYKAIWFRWGFPWATAKGYKHFKNYVGPFPTIPPDEEDEATNEPEILPDLTQMLSVVGSSAHSIEDPLNESLPMPTILAGTHFTTQEASDTQSYSGIRLGTFFPLVDGVYTGLPPNCPNSAFDPPDACYAETSWEWPYRVQKVADSSGNINYVHKHRHPYVRLFSNWWNPHWNYALWFVPDESDDDVQWQIESSPAPAKDYWLLIAQQHLTHASLPEGEDVRTRNFVLDSPLNFSGLRDLTQSTYFSQWTSWPGISRFERVEPTIPAEIQLDAESEPAWSMEDGTLGFGSSITIDPDGSGPGTAIVELDIGRFLDSAYQYPYLCRDVFLDWSLTNVDAVRVYLESYSGDRHLLEATPGDGFTTRNQAYSLTSWADSKYAGSWGQEFGADFLSDFGIDKLANGVSPALMADTERQFAFGLLTLRHGTKLRFEIDVTDRSSGVTLEYPKWQKQEDEPEQIIETASTSSLLFPDGPGIRVGQWSFFDYDADAFAPGTLIRPPGNRMSALDALCLKRNVFEGIAPDDGLDTEIATLFENGIEYTTRKHLARDPIEFRQTTLGMLVQGATTKVLLLAISSLRECPPLACFPCKPRDTDWNKSGDHAQTTYSFCVEPRRYVKQGTIPIHLNEGGVTWTSTQTPPSGWKVTKHTHAVDGTEGQSKLLVGSRWIAASRPWHGYFGTAADITGEGSNPWNLNSMIGQYHRANVEDGDVWYRRASFGTPYGGFENELQVTNTGDCHHPHMSEDGRPVLYLVYCRDSVGLCIRASFDEGTTFGEESVLIADATFCTIQTGPLGELVALGFIPATGKIMRRYRGIGDSSWTAATAIKDDAGADMLFEEDSFHVSPDKSGAIRWVAVWTIQGESGCSEWQSTDECQTFKLVT